MRYLINIVAIPETALNSIDDVRPNVQRTAAQGRDAPLGFWPSGCGHERSVGR